MMSAEEFYEVVKDVPIAAWPRGIRTLDLHGGGRKFYVGNGNGIMPEDATLMFEASMTRWLADPSYLFVQIVLRDDNRWSVDLFVDSDKETSFVATTLVEALAAACKEVAGREKQ